MSEGTRTPDRLDHKRDAAKGVLTKVQTLLTSELVTNAVRHGKGQITLQVSLNDDRLLVEVTDEGGGLEKILRERELDQVGGWGLQIVDAASSRWGTHTRHHSRLV